MNGTADRRSSRAVPHAPSIDPASTGSTTTASERPTRPTAAWRTQRSDRAEAPFPSRSVPREATPTAAAHARPTAAGVRRIPGSGIGPSHQPWSTTQTVDHEAATTNHARMASARWRPRATSRAKAGTTSSARPKRPSPKSPVSRRNMASVPRPWTGQAVGSTRESTVRSPSKAASSGRWSRAATATPPAPTVARRASPARLPARPVPTTSPTTTMPTGTTSAGSTATAAASARPVTRTSDHRLRRRVPGPGSPPRLP